MENYRLVGKEGFSEMVSMKGLASGVVALALAAILIGQIVVPQISTFYDSDWGSAPAYMITIFGLIFLFAGLGLAMQFYGHKD